MLPEREVDHPLGCHRPRIPDRVVFEKLVEVLVFGCAYWRIADESCLDTTLRRRRDEWIDLGVMDALRETVLNAYDRIIGLELSDVAVDDCITKVPCGGERAGRSPVDRGKRGIKRSAAVDARGIPLGTVTAPANLHDSPLLVPTLDGIVPGTTGDETIDQHELDAWVSEARVATTVRGRARSADRCIGRVLAASPIGEDGAWPHEAVRAEIDRLESDDVDDAFRDQVINSRGVYAKDYLEGGDQERELAEKYRGYADALGFRWPRTSAVLSRMADFYDRWARRHDAEAERREDS